MRGERGTKRGALKAEQRRNREAELSGEELWARREGQTHTLETRVSPPLQHYFNLKMPNCSSV